MSTKEQVAGYSLGTQDEELKRYCEFQGWTLDRVFEDQGESAKTADRPALQALLTYCREHKTNVDVVLVHRVDRLARNMFDHHHLRAQLVKLGIVLRSVAEPIENTASGELMENMLASFAQFDNQVRADRSMSGMKAAVLAGRWVWKAPVGYQSGPPGGPSLEHHLDTAPIVRQLFEEFASGRLNKRELRDRGAALGLRGVLGGELSVQLLDRMLPNPLYMGLVRVPKWSIEAEGDFDPIVSEDVFLRVQAILDGRRPKVGGTRLVHPDFPLRRFVKCAKCGLPLTAAWSRGNGGKYAYYWCRDTTCGVRSARADLERGFLDILLQIQPKPALVNLFREVVLDVWKQRQGEVQTERQQVEKRLRRIVARKDRLVEEYVHRRAIDEPTFHRHMDLLSEQETIAKLRLHDAELDGLDVENVLAFAGRVLTNMAESWNHMNPEQKRRFQSLIFPDGITFDGERFGTTESASIFKKLEPATSVTGSMASPRRFELRLPA